MAALPEYDDEMTKRTEEAKANGKKLRYVGVVDVANGAGAVELREYEYEPALRAAQRER